LLVAGFLVTDLDTVGVLYHDHSGETILSRLPKKDIERFAEQAAAEIVEIWKGKMEGEELDKINGSKPLARIAMDWLERELSLSVRFPRS
jgi:hypothetical protein